MNRIPFTVYSFYFFYLGFYGKRRKISKLNFIIIIQLPVHGKQEKETVGVLATSLSKHPFKRMCVYAVLVLRPDRGSQAPE